MTERAVPAVSPQLPRRSWRIVLGALRGLPQGALSRGFGRVADTPIPRPLRRTILGTFARALGINAAEAELGIEEYGSLNSFFVRRLKAGARQWPAAADVAGSPVDGVVGQFGQVTAGSLVQAKGRWYRAADLLDDASEAVRYSGGSFLTLYLSPRHYHRVHAPCSGTLSVARHLPGSLLPVNAPSVAHIPNLFCRNERLICYLDGKFGRVAVVAVGAYNVGRISAAFDRDWSEAGWVTNRRATEAETRSYDPPVQISAGQEIMAFHLGSTVIVLLEHNRAHLLNSLEIGEEVLLGQPVARLEH